MVFKFECPSCGQRLSATPDLYGRENVCPTCESAFTVPVPPGENTQAAELAAKIAKLGVPFTVPEHLTAEDLIPLLDELDALFSHGLEELYQDWEMEGEIVFNQRPTFEQFCAIGAEIVAFTLEQMELPEPSLIQIHVLRFAPHMEA